MLLAFSSKSQKDLEYFSISEPKLVAKIFRLILEIQKDPLKGSGKPELLKYNKQGYYSRRITKEHRLVYKIESGTIHIQSCKGHYE